MPIPLPDPNLQSTQEASSRVPERVPHPNFQLAHDPEDWQMSGDGELLPVLVHCARKSGVNGYNGHKNKRIDDLRWAAARSQGEAQGLIYIPFDVMGSSADRGYVTPYQTERGGVTHRPFVAQPVRQGRATRWVVNENARRAFIRFLRAKKIIPPPKPHVVRHLLAQQRTTVQMAIKVQPAKDSPGHQTWAEQVAALEKGIVTLEEELRASEAHYGADQDHAAFDQQAHWMEAMAEQAEAEVAQRDAGVATIQAAMRTEPEPGPVADDEPQIEETLATRATDLRDEIQAGDHDAYLDALEEGETRSTVLKAIAARRKVVARG